MLFVTPAPLTLVNLIYLNLTVKHFNLKNVFNNNTSYRINNMSIFYTETATLVLCFQL